MIIYGQQYTTIISLPTTLLILYHFWYLGLLEPDALTCIDSIIFQKKVALARLPAMSESERFRHHQVMAIPGGSARKVCTMCPGRLVSSNMLAGPFSFTYKLLQEPPENVTKDHMLLGAELQYTQKISKACLLFALQLMPAAHLFELAGYRQRTECPARTTYILWTLLT